MVEIMNENITNNNATPNGTTVILFSLASYHIIDIVCYRQPPVWCSLTSAAAMHFLYAVWPTVPSPHVHDLSATVAVWLDRAMDCWAFAAAAWLLCLQLLLLLLAEAVTDWAIACEHPAAAAAVSHRRDDAVSPFDRRHDHAPEGRIWRATCCSFSIDHSRSTVAAAAIEDWWTTIDAVCRRTTVAPPATAADNVRRSSGQNHMLFVTVGPDPGRSHDHDFVVAAKREFEIADDCCCLEIVAAASYYSSIR